MGVLLINAQIVDASLFNNNVGNWSITGAKTDTILSGTKPVLSIKTYSSEKSSSTLQHGKKFQNKNFYLNDLVSYRPDGKVLSKERYYDNIIYKTQYYFDDFGKLILKKETSSQDKTESFTWLVYDKKQFLDYELTYENFGKNELRYKGLTLYKKENLKDELKVNVLDYGMDSLLSLQDVYHFQKDQLIVEMPARYAKTSYYKLLEKKYQVYKIDGYYIDGRIANYEHDKNGFLVKEWWILKDKLENKTELFYNQNYTERIEQQYHLLGTEKSTKITRKYNKQGDKIFEQSIEYTGNPLSIDTWDYIYDESNNWIECKKYNQDVEKGVLGKKKLVSQSFREIQYYKDISSFSQDPIPSFDQRANRFLAEIPHIADQHTKEEKELQLAIENEMIDEELADTSHDKIEDFTPKYWKLKDEAYGNLDADPDDEAIAVWETPIDGDWGAEQVLGIFKKENGKWKLWHQNKTVVMSTQSGGMMGNPFDGISIKNKSVVIEHFGGSRQKWNYTHRYRFQNDDWYLIGASVVFGAPDYYFLTFDYNLSTGDIIASYKDGQRPKTTKDWFQRINQKIKLPKMDQFSPGDNQTMVNNREIYW